MKKSTILLTLAVLLMAVSCANSLSNVLARARDSKTANDAWKHYTAGSIKYINKIDEIATEFQLDEQVVVNEVPASCKWEVVSEEISGESAIVRVKFLEHPEKELIGKEKTFKMYMEANTWKIDNEEKLKILYEMMKETAGILKQMSPVIDDNAREILIKTVERYN